MCAFEVNKINFARSSHTQKAQSSLNAFCCVFERCSESARGKEHCTIMKAVFPSHLLMTYTWTLLSVNFFYCPFLIIISWLCHCSLYSYTYQCLPCNVHKTSYYSRYYLGLAMYTSPPYFCSLVLLMCCKKQESTITLRLSFVRKSLPLRVAKHWIWKRHPKLLNKHLLLENSIKNCAPY